MFFFRNKLSLKEAIDYITDAWNRVTKTTICNCWKKVDILLITAKEEIPTVIQQIENDEYIDNQEVVTLLDNITMDLPQSTGNIKAFIEKLDDDLPTEEMLSDEQIVRLVQEETANGDDDNDTDQEPPVISLKDGIKRE